MEEPPPVAVGVDKAVRIHKSKVLRLVISRASRSDGLRDQIVHLLAALAIEAEQGLRCLGRIADAADCYLVSGPSRNRRAVEVNGTVES